MDFHYVSNKLFDKFEFSSAWCTRTTFVFQVQIHLCLKTRRRANFVFQKQLSKFNMFDFANNL